MSGRLRCPNQLSGWLEALLTVVLVLVTALPALLTFAMALGAALLLAVLVTAVPLALAVPRVPVDTRARSLERER